MWSTPLHAAQTWMNQWWYKTSTIWDTADCMGFQLEHGLCARFRPYEQ